MCSHTIYPTRAMLLDVTSTPERLQVVLDRISISPSCSHSLSNYDPPAARARKPIH